ncbi:DASH complex subunit ask1 [Lobaria immixta]|nr:DASH complex subunit ask1 [Lobaria immixta]
MSRANPSSQRNLTLTEELEKLEQSITLTLQEIDHNFSRAHRIVTTSILPVVEKYAEHSKDVWEGSKFWKQFFEASANVSLSGYEEPPAEDETVTEENTQTTPSSSAYGSPSLSQNETVTPKNRTVQSATNEDSTITSTPSHATPRAPTTARKPPTIAPYSSPYEALKREVQGGPSHPHTDEPSSSTLPSTPRTHQQSPDLQSSPFLPSSTSQQTSRRTPANDVLLHRILDKNWRLQATPHAQARAPMNLPYRSGGKATETPQPSARRRGRQDQASDPDSPDSSPPVPAPELHPEIFDSPVRRPRVPGVSILTPARKRDTPGGKSRSALGGEDLVGAGRKMADIWDSDSDDEREMEGMSPPKTMQFHVPQSRLLRTPAREASKRIVEDLLLTAGGNVTDDVDEDSPSVIKRGGLLDEDTF